LLPDFGGILKLATLLGLHDKLVGLRCLLPSGRHVSSSLVRWEQRPVPPGTAAFDNSEWSAVFVNLARRQDRRVKLTRTLAAGNSLLLARLAWVEAVDGRGVDLQDKDLLRFVTAGAMERAREAKRDGAFTVVHQRGKLLQFNDHLTEGGIACAMSHFRALEAVATHPTAAWGIILEDDVSAVVPNVHAEISKVLRTLPPQWDALFLGYHGGALRATEPTHPEETEHEDEKAQLELIVDQANAAHGFHGSVDGYDRLPVLRMFAPVYGLYAWVVRREAAGAILEGAFPIDGQVDHAVSQWLVRERCQSFRLAPRHMLFFSPKSEDALDSDVQTLLEV